MGLDKTGSKDDEWIILWENPQDTTAFKIPTGIEGVCRYMLHWGIYEYTKDIKVKLT